MEQTHTANLTAAFKINLGAEALAKLRPKQAMTMEEKAQSNKRLCAWLSDPEDPEKNGERHCQQYQHRSAN
jgi:hypothetical protein